MVAQPKYKEPTDEQRQKWALALRWLDEKGSTMFIDGNMWRHGSLDKRGYIIEIDAPEIPRGKKWAVTEAGRAFWQENESGYVFEQILANAKRRKALAR